MVKVTLFKKENHELFNVIWNATRVEAGFLPGRPGLYWIVEDADSVTAKPVSEWYCEIEEI